MVFFLKAEGWIDEKLKTATGESFTSTTDLQKKMKMLQKHQAFEAEIMANTDRIKDIKQVCKMFPTFSVKITQIFFRECVKKNTKKKKKKNKTSAKNRKSSLRVVLVFFRLENC